MRLDQSSTDYLFLLIILPSWMAQDSFSYIMDSHPQQTFPFPVIGQMYPTGKHLNPKKLLRRIGNSFDPEWMSVKDPSENKLFQNSSGHESHPNDLYTYSMTRARVSDILRDRYNFGIEIESLDVIVTFLHDLTTCRVKYKWEDLGQLFWPRFVRKGSCDSSGPCSWPPGMRCQIGQAKTLQFLRWICKKGRRKIARQNKNDNFTSKRKNQKSNHVRLGDKVKCKWRKVPYEITTSCVCRCD